MVFGINCRNVSARAFKIGVCVNQYQKKKEESNLQKKKIFKGAMKTVHTTSLVNSQIHK